MNAITKKLKIVSAFATTTTTTTTTATEFLPEIWGLIKQFAIAQYVEPVQIGERFIYYAQDDFDRNKLMWVKLCERTEDRVPTLQFQQKSFVPIIKDATYRVLQTITPKPTKNDPNKTVISRLDKRTLQECKEQDEDFKKCVFWIRRYVESDQNLKTYYWNKPNEKHIDKLYSKQPFNKTKDLNTQIQFYKTDATKLTRSMFPEFNL